MAKEQEGFYIYKLPSGAVITPYVSNDYGIATRELVELDGFSSAEQMFDYFDKKYDLSEPKQFYVYRWRWIT